MGSIYDLSSGNKGFTALATMHKIGSYKRSARHIRMMNAVYDPMESQVAESNKHAGELERKALELERQMRARE